MLLSLIMIASEEVNLMTTKNKVLNLLNQNPGKVFSGQAIADHLQISRTAIWKAVQSLKEEGFAIQSLPNAGYLLSSHVDLLHADTIKSQLREEVAVFVHPFLGSTNAEAKRMLSEGERNDVLVLADEQTAGRGRLGRSFFSPAKSGLYMSLGLVKLAPQMDPTLLTTMAAVAVCRAIEQLTERNPQIKWVNDLYIDGKKICGILTEGIINLETQTIDSIVLGIGLNVQLEPVSMPEELKEKMGALFVAEEPTITRNQLAISIVNEFYLLYSQMDKNEYLEEYRSRCFVLGKQINFTRNKEYLEGMATAIDDKGALVVRLQDGTETTLSYGEISIGWTEGAAK